MNKIRWVALAFTVFILKANLTATALSDLANSMNPGTWKQLPSNFPGGGYNFFIGGNNILQYADSGTWDPIHRKVVFMGGGHIGISKLVIYDELSNQWSGITDFSPNGPVNTGGVDPNNPYAGYIGHAYDHNALDPTRGIFYYTPRNGTMVFSFNPATLAWARLPDVPLPSSDRAATYVLEFDVERDALIHVNPVTTNGNIYSLKTGAPTWEIITTSNYRPDYNHTGEYDTLRKVLYFGGGGGPAQYEFYRLDRTNNIVTRLANPLRGIKTPDDFSTEGGIHTTDPVTGNFIQLNHDGKIYEYDGDTNKWSQVATNVPASITSGVPHAASGAVVIPISSYGLIMYIKYAGDSSSVWLYKHKQGSVNPPDTTLPAAPKNLRMQ